MITVNHSENLAIVSCLYLIFTIHHLCNSGVTKLIVSCDNHIVILSSSDQWHLVETNCNNIFTTRNSWNISRSSEFCIFHFITTNNICLWDHGWLESPGIYSLPSSSAFSKLIRKSVITRAGAAPGLSWHHVIMSHDIITLMTSCHMTCHHHLPQPSSQSRFQSDQCWPRPCEHLNKLKGFVSRKTFI